MSGSEYSKSKSGDFTGIQTVFPGSVHPSGEEIRWDKNIGLGEVDAKDLIESCNRLAAACIILQNYPKTGSRHDFFLAVSGGLAKSGVTLENAKKLLEPVIMISGDEELDARLHDVDKTYAKFLSGDQNITGWSRVKEFIDEKSIKKLGEYLSVKINYVVNTSNRTTFDAEVWSDPVSFLPISVDPMLPEMLPEAIRGFACDVAYRKNVPLDFTAVALICFIGNAMGRKFSIQPKRNDESWKEFPNLWGAIIADPSARKTPAMQEIKKFVQELEVNHSRKYKSETLKFKVKSEHNKLQQKKLEREYVSALPGNNKIILDNIENKRILLENEIENLKPKLRQYIVNDATVEKLCQIMQDNPFGVLVFRDELPGFLNSFKKTGYENAREFYLEAWGGQGHHKKQRVSGELDAEINGLCCGVFGSIQPQKLAPYVEEAHNPIGSDGLLPRFQLACFPDPIPHRYVDEKPNLHAEQRVRSIFQKIDAYCPPYNNITQEYIEKKFIFDGEAQEIYMNYENELGRDRDDFACSSAIAKLKGKYTGLVSSLALIFHVIDIFDGKSKNIISKDNIEMAVKWCRYLESHARKIYRVNENSYSNGAKSLLKMIFTGEIGRNFIASDTYRNRREFLTTRRDAEPVLSELCNYGWIRKIERSTGKFSYEAHPEFDKFFQRRNAVSVVGSEHNLPYSAYSAYSAQIREEKNISTDTHAGKVEETDSTVGEDSQVSGKFGIFGIFGVNFDGKKFKDNSLYTHLHPENACRQDFRPSLEKSGDGDQTLGADFSSENHAEYAEHAEYRAWEQDGGGDQELGDDFLAETHAEYAEHAEYGAWEQDGGGDQELGDEFLAENHAEHAEYGTWEQDDLGDQEVGDEFLAETHAEYAEHAEYGAWEQDGGGDQEYGIEILSENHAEYAGAGVSVGLPEKAGVETIIENKNNLSSEVKSKMDWFSHPFFQTSFTTPREEPVKKPVKSRSKTKTLV
ncbi:MAG: DUF3987 domain-containing protein [Oligoflexales bacterium]|nr:DUF3987 domain-containing protein [Oligoflexales bacterium]